MMKTSAVQDGPVMFCVCVCPASNEWVGLIAYAQYNHPLPSSIQKQLLVIKK